MKQITEDYVSFEIAVLLKENKFGWKCNTAYLEFEDGGIELRYEDKAFYQEQLKRRYCVPALLAPSLYNVMKWLREVHKLHITVVPFPLNFEHQDIQDGWGCDVTHLSDLSYDDNYEFFQKKYPIYEEACEAAIKYCLENLI